MTKKLSEINMLKVVAVSGLILGTVSLIRNRIEEAQYAKRRKESEKNFKEQMAKLDVVQTQLDKALEKARFWDIVTRDL